jgi:CBS domain containing-hemolysin-like protein
LIELLLIVIALLLVAACGAFVAAEFAFVTVDRSQAEAAARSGDAKARGVVAALGKLSTQLSAAQLGITATNLLIGYMAEPSIARLIDGPLTSIGLSEDAAEGTAVIVALVLATGVTMVFGELVPKNLAIARPLATARAVQRFMRVFTAATAIVIRAFNGTANAILRRIGIEPQEELASARSPEELSSLVRRSAEQGTLELETARLVERSITFGDRRAADVMTPRVRVETVHSDAAVIDVLRQARATGRSRFPVLDADGAVAGAVHVKHAMGVPNERRSEVPVSHVMVEPVLVPSSVELDPLLTMLRGGGLQMGIVVDEWGNVDGIVTLEDLIEEIVGDVRDEYDPQDDSIRRDGDAWNVSALLRPDELAGRIGVALPEDEEYETLGGLIGLQLERMPEAGDAVEVDGVRLTVLSMDGLRVDRVRLERK